MSNVPLKLDAEERDELNEFLDGHGWPLVLKVTEALVRQQVTRLLNTPATESENIIIEKAKYEGARDLLKKLSLIKEQYSLSK